MPALASDLRRQLENVIIDAREKAEAAARAALKRLAIDAPKPFDHFSDEQRAFRNRLRARARQAGDVRKANGEQEIDQLTQELAYEYWHRMLFARFLAENHLLMHPDGVAVSLAECDELASHEGAENGFVLAARYASRMLPRIFRTDDVLLEVDFPINDRLPLEKLLASLPTDTFIADDSLGWVYQFWQTKKKKEVNESGEKIDGRTLPAVTQLFTEPYMVKFLLHNTIGAWWAGRQGVGGQGSGISEEGLRKRIALPNYEFEYLRFLPDGTPAAGTFDGWPNSLKEFTMLDPCCGSGHFLVEAFNLLVPMRMHDEGLSAQEACDAVLAENLFGLELDPRCTQIAAFALALAAWKYPVPRQDAWATHSTQLDRDDTSFQPEAGKGGPDLQLQPNRGGTGFQPETAPGGTGFQPVSLGYRPLPPLNIACSGQSVTGKKEEWLALANGDSRLRDGMGKLYDLFTQAPHLGSLIDPRREGGDLFVAGFAELQPLLERALEKEKIQQDADAAAVNVAAQGIAKAAELLARPFSLVATNVPFLGREKQTSLLRDFCDSKHSVAKYDLAAAFLERCLELCHYGSSISVVNPQNWLFQPRYSDLRRKLLKEVSFDVIAQLGERGFESSQAAGAFTALFILTRISPTDTGRFVGFDASDVLNPTEKAQRLLTSPPCLYEQGKQLGNPDARIVLGEVLEGDLLGKIAQGVQGLATSDDEQFVCCFWELQRVTANWTYLQGPVIESTEFGGREHVLLWESGEGRYYKHAMALKREGRLGGWKSGRAAWRKLGVSVSEMRSLPCTLYLGDMFDHSAHVIVPDHPDDLLAIWTFCKSSKFLEQIRRIDQKLNVTNNTLVKVPFDRMYWRSVAAEEYPNGLPEPFSDDLTQWLFKGDIAPSTDPLQVAVARMLGYRWPEQPKEKDKIDALADEDGIVCIPAVRSEKPGAERLLEILQAAYRTGKIPVPSQEQVSAEKGGTGFQPVQADQFTRRNLPHIQKPGHSYHVIFRTVNLTLLPEDRKIVFDACRFWDGKKMCLHACVVMPDHVHLLLTPLELVEGPGQFFSLAEILHSIKSYSANQVNRLRGRKGTLWLDENYDRYIRSESDFEEKYWYVANNPIKEGLSQGVHDYPFLYLAWDQQEESTGKMPVPPQEQLQAGKGNSGFQLMQAEAGKGGTGFQPVQGEDHTSKVVVPIEKLLTDAGCTPGTSLDEWLRNEFFAQHCKRFHNRPFIWHIWDGRKDGFSCLVNYHKLNHKRLETLTYSYLQDWITAQTAAAKDGKPGADLRLVAAQELQNKLKLILTGEPPYDIFVRWKPIEAQPIGWDPDLNDGVRMNIRPFMTAEVLRKKPTINWSKDRGNEPVRDQEQYPWFWKDGKFTGDRVNDYHLTNAQKRAARGKEGKVDGTTSRPTSPEEVVEESGLLDK